MLRRFLAITGGNLIRQASSFIAQLLVAHRAGTAAFGTLTFAFSIYLLMAGIGDFGSRLYCWRTVAALPPDERAAAAHDLVWKRFFLALALLVPINLVIYFVAPVQVAWILHCYSIAIAFNQVAFDWWFLSQERIGGLLVFNVACGLLLLASTYVLVRGPDDIATFALLLSFACGVPGVAMTMLGRGLPRLRLIVEGIGLPRLTSHYVGYDWFQRIYQAFIPIVAWLFYSRAAIGQFRIAYLFYWFAGTLAIYVGSSVFNRLARSSSKADSRQVMGTVVAMLLLIVLPFSAVATVLADRFVDRILGADYETATLHLAILLPCLAIPVASNFLREATVAAGKPIRAMRSYVGTVVLTTAGIAFFYQHGMVVLSVATLVGEALGGLPLLVMLRGEFWRGALLWRLPVGILSYPLIIALGRYVWINPGFWHPYGTLAVNGTFLTAVAGAIIGVTLLAERWVDRNVSMAITTGAEQPPSKFRVLVVKARSYFE
jgi:O-antigen/teichoic acid export membrane protein